MQPPALLRAVAVDDQGMIVEDVPCCMCAYNLRGLRPEGLCPECAAPIATSLRDERLSLADPEWTRRLAAGARWMLAAELCVLAGSSLGISVLGAGDVYGRAELVLGLWVVAGLAILVALRGAWLLTKRDPFEKARPSGWWPRRVTRIALSIGLGLEAIGAPLFVSWRSPLGASINLALGLVRVAVTLVVAAGLFGLLVQIEWLARRLPHPEMARWACVLRWAYPASLVAQAAVTCLYWSLLGDPIRAERFYEWDMVIVAGLSSPISRIATAAEIAWLVLLWKLGSALTVQARAARSYSGTRGPQPPQTTGTG
jgi:hypothetical protein